MLAISNIHLRRSSKGVPHWIVNFDNGEKISIVYKSSKNAFWIFEWKHNSNRRIAEFIAAPGDDKDIITIMKEATQCPTNCSQSTEHSKKDIDCTDGSKDQSW